MPRHSAEQSCLHCREQILRQHFPNLGAQAVLGGQRENPGLPEGWRLQGLLSGGAGKLPSWPDLCSPGREGSWGWSPAALGAAFLSGRGKVDGSGTKWSKFWAVAHPSGTWLVTLFVSCVLYVAYVLDRIIQEKKKTGAALLHTTNLPFRSSSILPLAHEMNAKNN